MTASVLARSALLAAAFSLALGAAAPRAGAAPARLHYQGFLTDADGRPVDGEWTLTFRLYPAEDGGTPLFEETRTVTLERGVFWAALGADPANALPVAAFQRGEAVWIGVAVEGAEGTVELGPRQVVASHPYALFAGRAEACAAADDALALGGTPADQFATLGQLGELCVAPADLPGLLEDLGYAPGALDDEALHAWLTARGYVTGPHFSGAWGDLSGRPDLSAFLTEEALAGYCAAPCYGDADVAALLEAGGYEPGPAYGDADVRALLAAHGYEPCACYGDADVDARLAVLGVVPGPHYGDADVQAWLDAAGYVAGPRYGDADVQAWLDAAGYVAGPHYGDADVQTWLDAQGYVAGPHYGDADVQTWLDAQGYTPASELVRRDGSLALLGDWDVARHQLLNVVVHNAASAEPPATPVAGQLWWDTTGRVLRIHDGDGWLALGEAGPAVALDCDGCVGLSQLADAAEAALGYSDSRAVAAVEAAGFVRGGAPVTAAQLPADGVDEVSNGVLTTTFRSTFDSPDTPLANDPLSGRIRSVVTVPDIGTIQDLSVDVDIAHPDIGELAVTLTGPDGAAVVLHDRGAGGTADLVASFDPDTPLPAGSLADWLGAEAAGDWALEIVDLTVGNEGTLRSWRLAPVALSRAHARVAGDLDVDGDLAVGGSLTVGGVAVDPGRRTYAVPGADAPPGTAVVERYYVGAPTDVYCKKRVRPTCSCGCGTALPAWTSSDPDCTTGECVTNCEGNLECTPATFPDGWSAAPPAGDFYVYTGDQAGCNCGPFWYRYRRVQAAASWTRVQEP